MLIGCIDRLCLALVPVRGCVVERVCEGALRRYKKAY